MENVLQRNIRNEEINKKISTRTPPSFSLEKQNTTTNNNHNNNKNNTSNSKKNNKLITIVILKTNANFNYVTVEEENGPVSKKVMLKQNANTEKGPSRKQIHLPKLKDGKITRELASDNSAYITCFA